jgi:hypothetical protein
MAGRYLVRLREPKVSRDDWRRLRRVRQHNPTYMESPSEATEAEALVCQEQRVEAFAEFLKWFTAGGEALTLRDRVDILNEAVAKTYKYDLQDLFEGLLTQYEMSAKDRKVMERAARDMDRRRRYQFKFDPVTIMKTYATKRKAFRKYLEVARRVVEGKPIDRGACAVAGGFRIINTGAFNPKVMKVVEGVVADASEAMRKVGLESLIYGDINVVGSIRGSRRSIAHYSWDTDLVFIRANLRGREGPAEKTVLHELAHRLEKQFDPARGQRALKKLYNAIKDQDEEATRSAVWDRSLWPEKGTPLDKKWKVAGVSIGGRPPAPRVELALLEDPEPLSYKAHVGMANYQRSKGVLHGAFVTSYARTSPSENFAEMVAAWCSDELPDDQQDLLLKAIGEGLGT